MKYVIEMPDNWEPGNCLICPFDGICGGYVPCHLNTTIPVREMTVLDVSGKTFSEKAEVWVEEKK